MHSSALTGIEALLRQHSRRIVVARAFSRETEALWTAFRLTPEEKERVWLAAYDAPWHGQASSPYRGAVFAEMDLHITNTHRRFVSEAERALGAAGAGDLSSELFLKAVGRVMLLLGVRREDAIQVMFKVPQLVATSEAQLARAIIALRNGRPEKDLAALIASTPSLLADVLQVSRDGGGSSSEQQRQEGGQTGVGGGGGGSGAVR